MKILIQAPFDLKDLQKETIETSLSELSKFDDRITQAEVYFKLDDGQNNNEVSAKIRLHIPGNDVIVSAGHEDRMKAFHDAQQKAKRQLIKVKEARRKH